MEVKVRVKKCLPKREGEGRNGHYCFLPVIVEWIEETSRGETTHALIVEFSETKFDLQKIAECENTNKEISMFIGLDVENTDKGYFNRVYGFIRDAEYRKERTY